MKKYIDSGWNNYRRVVVPKNASAIQLNETRQAFFAGAAILFQILMTQLDPGEQETDADMQVMEDIQLELEEYGHTLDRHVFRARGH